jgi:hypothetical protein
VWEIIAMRKVVLTAMLIIAALPAHAQMAGMGGRRHHSDGSNSEQKKPSVDEKAYKAALEKIPEPKQKYDPWGVARPTDPSKNPK